MVGEPVLLNLEINNTGSEDVYWHAKNPSGCLGSTATEYFQDIAMTVSRSKDAQAVPHAVGALERINTAETRAALGDLLTTDEAHTEMRAIRR
jgi:hypothetical protein